VACGQVVLGQVLGCQACSQLQFVAGFASGVYSFRCLLPLRVCCSRRMLPSRVCVYACMRACVYACMRMLSFRPFPLSSPLVLSRPHPPSPISLTHTHTPARLNMHISHWRTDLLQHTHATHSHKYLQQVLTPWPLSLSD